jgi:acetyl-CoA C-acetyltransferase
MAEALRRAADDSGVGASALTGADTVHAVRMLSWRYRDVGRLVAERLGADPRTTTISGVGGNVPQSLVNLASLAIRDGRADLVLVGGAEAWRTRVSSRTAGAEVGWTVQGQDVPEAAVSLPDVPMASAGELARSVFMPVQVYPLFEQAYRIQTGRALDEHLQAMAELWARFSAVAARNPHAWIQKAFTAEEIRTPAVDNRMVGFPYTKRMNSNSAVEQGAAVILCSVERAQALGVPRDRCVFPHSGTDAHDHYFATERADLGRSPAIRLAARDALALAGVGVDDLAHVDLYSCFPSAVEIAAMEIGLATDRPLTVTGGLSFAGGPWNNYVMHSLATMVERLREEPGTRGLVTANGGHITKHAIGVYSTEPPAAGFRHSEPQSEVDALPRRVLCEDPEGDIAIEAWTAMHDRNGSPETGILVGLLPDGRRALGTTTDAVALQALVTEDLAGRTARITPDGSVDLL